MDIDIIWILLGLPIAFGLGWLASRLDFRQLRIENRRSPKAYFKGLNYLLNEQQDLAIDAFIEAVQLDPDTSELHFALGNLFRKRGEYHRAVRVHEHLLARADLKQIERDRAQHALSQDFVHAGLLDRAEEALSKLEGTAYESQARLARLLIYERTRDWLQAGQIAQQLQDAQVGDFSQRMAHYTSEQALTQSPAQAKLSLTQAVALAPHAARARIALAHIAGDEGQPLEALNWLLSVIEYAPAATPLIADQLQNLAIQCDQIVSVMGKLQAYYTQTFSMDTLHALAALHTHVHGAQAGQALYISHLQTEASLAVAARLLASEKLDHPQFQLPIQRALDKAVKPLLRYRCAACGFEAVQHLWQCPGCQAWDSYPARRIEEL